MDELERARQLREQRRITRPIGAFRPSGRKQDVIAKVMARVDAAAERRDPCAYYAGQMPAPERITLALDFNDLYGPEVDRALGGEEPMVDEWESGTRVPDVAQVQALAKLTGFPVRFFYLPAPPSLEAFACGTGGCTYLNQGAPASE